MFIHKGLSICGVLHSTAEAKVVLIGVMAYHSWAVSLTDVEELLQSDTSAVHELCTIDQTHGNCHCIA